MNPISTKNAEEMIDQEYLEPILALMKVLGITEFATYWSRGELKYQFKNKVIIDASIFLRLMRLVIEGYPVETSNGDG